MYPRVFLAILPVLLSTFAPSLALPVQSSNTLSIGARSFDFSSDTTPLVSRDDDNEPMVEWTLYKNNKPDVHSHAITEDLFPRANRPKRTAAEAKQRKADVKAKVSTNQAHNAAKKIDLIAKAAALPHPYVIFSFLHH